ncbi:protein of unknown function [Paenibacillus alvei]|uniref:Uncharacterized protein n=1 Tax=Paenibacillus alvei TaxID=44250 RepID=A0A383RKQ5_PAEAL|nr:protein of unknown function [Paenibacillus alvei]
MLCIIDKYSIYTQTAPAIRHRSQYNQHVHSHAALVARGLSMADVRHVHPNYRNYGESMLEKYTVI